METEINDIILSKKTADVSLGKFIEKASGLFTFPELDKDNKRSDLWNAIFKIVSESEDPSTLAKCFTAIRILSREKKSLNDLVTEEWMEAMKLHSKLHEKSFVLNKENEELVREVGKCMSNVIFNCLRAAKLSVKVGILDGLVSRIKYYSEPNFSEEIKILDMKLIFLITALQPQVRSKLKTELRGFKEFFSVLNLVLKQAAENEISEGYPSIYLTDQQVELVSGLMKALFNITLHCNGNDPEELATCIDLVKILCNYLLIPTKSEEKKTVLQNDVVNLLTNMPNESYKYLITPVSDEDQNLSKNLQYDGQNMTAIYEILMILKGKFHNESAGSYIEILTPIICVLLKCATSNRSMRKYLRIQVLPPLKDVHSRPEEGTTLRNYLCRLLTSPYTQLKDFTADFLFILCKKNVQRMIKYTGYGNAAGLFAQRGLLGGRRDEGETEFSSDSQDSETEEYAEHKHGINPVTGCFEEPRPDPMENMSEEQKEYEAMKLVQLIDNLTKCGTIQPCRVGVDGKPQPIEHILQLQECIKSQQVNHSDSESD